MIWRVVVFVAMGFILEVLCQRFAMNFKVVHEAIIDCPNKGTDEIQLRLKLLKFNRTMQVMNGFMRLYRDFDDTISIRVKLWTWQNGGWKAGTGLDFKKDKGCSSFIAVLGQVFVEIAAHSPNMPKKCPFKKGSWYNMSNLDARVWDKLPLPGAPMNKYKLEIGFETPEGKLTGCYSSVFRVSKK